PRDRRPRRAARAAALGATSFPSDSLVERPRGHYFANRVASDSFGPVLAPARDQGCRWLASNRPWDCRAYLAAQVASSNDGRTECDQCRHKAASRENKITGGRGGKRYGNGTASSRAKGHCGLVRRAGCDGARCAEG